MHEKPLAEGCPLARGARRRMITKYYGRHSDAPVRRICGGARSAEAEDGIPCGDKIRSMALAPAFPKV
jgi:hypothetical protein